MNRVKITAVVVTVMLLLGFVSANADTYGREPVTNGDIAARLHALIGAPGTEVNLGLLESGVDVEASATRHEALGMIIKCFQLERAEPNWSVLGRYFDVETLTPGVDRTMTVASEYGLIASSGYLRPFDEITRAEFNAALNSAVKRAYSASRAEAVAVGGTNGGESVKWDGGTVLYGATELKNIGFTGGVWFDCGSKNISLSGISADCVTIRSYKLDSLRIGEGVGIGRLVLASQSGDVEIPALSGGSHIGTLVIGDGGGRVVNRAECYRGVEVVGDNREVTLMSYTKSLVVSGDNVTITIPAGVTVGTLRILGDSVTVNANGKIGERIVVDKPRTLSEYYDYENALLLETERVLQTVSYVYEGDFTTEWATVRDYEDYEKELWVNAKRYASNSEYLIWVNLAYQRTNIFVGQQGEWELLRSGMVGTGRPGAGTPVGVWKTTYKQEQGWVTGSYMCKPVVGFLGGGYAFHSRLYYPYSDELKDPSVGFPVSAGCIRMMDEDIQFIFDNVPVGTTVVVF